MMNASKKEDRRNDLKVKRMELDLPDRDLPDANTGQCWRIIVQSISMALNENTRSPDGGEK
jgi:hypothetical protein